MKVKKKIISVIIATIVLIMISSNSVQASVNVSGLSGVSTILGLGSESITNGGTFINLSLSDMANANNKNLYCISYHNRNSVADKPYKVLAYIEIEDGNAKLWDVNGVSGRESGFNAANNILAEILSGNYGDTGYGSSTGNYTPTQKALYSYWPTWINEVGMGIGVDSSWLAGTDYSNSQGASIVNQATSAVGGGSTSSARIYLLNEWTGQGQSWQRLMIASASSTPEEEEDKPQNPDYSGYIKIRGRVWVDGSYNKANEINGKYGDSGDQGLGGIRVTLCNSGGGQFDQTSYATTNSDGTYEIKVNLDESPHVYKLYNEPKSVHERLMNAYVKFEYNGFTYTTTAPYNTGRNTSKAKESSGSRSSYDSNNTVVNPGTGVPTGNVEATTKNVISFRSYPYKTTDNETHTTVYCYGDGKHISYIDGDRDPTDRTYQLTNPDGEWLDVVYKYNQTAHDRTRHSHDESYDPPQYNIKYDEETGEEISRTEIYKDVFDYMSWCSGGHSIKTTSITNLIIEDVNLGLFVREQPDIALTSDISKVKVTMNNQEYTYLYGHKGIENYQDDNFKASVKFENKYTYTYRRPVNPADVAYVNDGNDKDNILNVYVTYKVLLKNQSNTLSVKVDKLRNYYDTEYTITSHQYTDISSNDKYKISTINNLNISIPKGESREVEITYSISQKAIKGLLKQDATLNNVFEINTYSTQYGSNTLCAEERTGASAGRTGSAYAGRDTDSSPGNASVYYDSSIGKLNIREFEDDTDIAPSFVLVLDEYKIVAGTVYEDTQTQASKQLKERLGNGIKDGKEVGIENVKVELLLVDDNGKIELDENKKPKVATIYVVDRKNGNGNNYKAVPAVTWTDANGNFSFGDNGKGVVIDKYIIRYTYGNKDIKDDGTNVASKLNGKEINARNFKSTIVTQDPIKSILSGTNASKRWHLETADNTTVAIDDLELRKTETDNSLIYANFDEKINMSADSPVFDLQVEYEDGTTSKVNKDGQKIEGNIMTGFKHKIETFDFGIIERPREDLIIDKSVTRLKLTLANGQILIDGDPRTEKLDYTKAIGVKNASPNAKDRNLRDKLITIEMDAEYIQGATLEVWYAVTATNNNEIDYEYSSNPKYYYYGDSKGLPLIGTAIDYVVDYLDPELMCTIEEGIDGEEGKNTNWEIKTADELYNNGYISLATYNKLKEENYLIFRTDAFSKDLTPGMSRTIPLYASKLLANQDNELVYENHVEIVSINGKVARTINSIKNDTREQINKLYKPGDYVPSTGRTLAQYIVTSGTEREGLHQQDDDMVKIVITPPTGLKTNVIIYITTVVIALTLIGVGIYIIKKKVIK